MSPSQTLQSSEAARISGGVDRRSQTHGTQAEADAQLEAEFDRWAQNGWGTELERDNRFLMEFAVNLLELRPGARVLDLSCGSGLATRMIAQRLATNIGGQVTGLDISSKMLELARDASRDYSNVHYIQGSADAMPIADESLDELVCVESLYYYPEQERALNEIYRVMTHQGRVYLVLRLYLDNPYADEFLSHLSIPAHVRSMGQYVSMLAEQGFRDVKASRVPEPRIRRGGRFGLLRRGATLLAQRPTAWIPAIREGLRTAHKRDRARSIGALLLTATKP